MKKLLILFSVFALLSLIPAPSYIPVDIPRTNLYAWYDFSGLVNNTTNAYGIVASNAISQISDISGNSRHFTQGTGANQPTLATGLNSLNAGTFDGGDYLNNTTDADWKFMHNGSYTVAALVKFGTAADPNVVYHWMGTGAASIANIGFLARYADRAASTESNAFEWYMYNGAANLGSTQSFNDRLTANSYQFLLIRVNTADAPIFDFTTSESGGSSASAGLTPSSSNATYDIQIGAGGNNSTPLVGGIQEIAIYNAVLGSGAAGQIALYWKNKYNIN